MKYNTSNQVGSIVNDNLENRKVKGTVRTNKSPRGNRSII